MRAWALFVIVAMPSTIWLRSLIAQQPNGQQSEQKHLIAFAGDGWENRLSARSIERAVEYPGIVYLKGEVEVRTPVCRPSGQRQSKSCDTYMVLRADEAELHEDTGRIDAYGNVSVVPLQRENGTGPGRAPALAPRASPQN
jgi:hypothetical protein